jgi:2-hydroxyglutarate dehydrogenase
VATTNDQMARLEDIHQAASQLSIPTHFISKSKALEIEPWIQAEQILVSPESGIMDVHGYMSCLEGDVKELGVDIAYKSKVLGVERISNGFLLSIQGEGGSLERIECSTLINAAGLHAHEIHNMLYPENPIRLYYCKGHYFSLTGLPRNMVSTLVYPVPDKNITSLGFHLTLDLAGMIKFG